MARSFAERNRFGRVGRIPTPTPLGVGDINCYVLFPPDGLGADGRLTLIDTGVKTPEAFEALRLGLKEFGAGVERIERILVTHAHMDHFGQAARLRGLSGARVQASRGEAALMRTHFSPSGDRREFVLASFRRWGVPSGLLERESQLAELARRIQDPIEVDGVLDDGDVVAVGDLRLEVIATPGHCDAHIVFWEPELRLLFSGDHLLTDISPVPLLVFPATPEEPRPKSLVRFMHSLERVESLPCELVFPAHGDVIRDHRKLIAGYRLHHERRKLQMLRQLRAEPGSAWALAATLFPKAYQTQVYLVMSEVIGHLDLLVDEGSVVVEERDGIEIARATV
ncbi:MAG TPA: MBL fold metallo-hydrolase [Myxococcota bacterium]|nr:MBL fold metallo-hydrolase [Myxococcota bacterium]